MQGEGGNGGSDDHDKEKARLKTLALIEETEKRLILRGFKGPSFWGDPPEQYSLDPLERIERKVDSLIEGQKKIKQETDRREFGEHLISGVVGFITGVLATIFSIITDLEKIIRRMLRRDRRETIGAEPESSSDQEHGTTQAGGGNGE